MENIVGKLEVGVEGLKRVLGDRIVGVLLFGSWARGEASGFSDVDVLVVLKGRAGFSLRGKIYSILSDSVGKPMTLITVDVDDLLNEDLEVTPILLNAFYDGIIIYDENSLLERLKAKVFKLVEKSGLVRYRTPDGKYGWKRVDGKPLEVVKVEV